MKELISMKIKCMLLGGKTKCALDCIQAIIAHCIELHSLVI